MPQTLILEAYFMMHGLIAMKAGTGGAPFVPCKITGITGKPLFYLNGSAAPEENIGGPWWSDDPGVFNWPFAVYQIRSLAVDGSTRCLISVPADAFASLTVTNPEIVLQPMANYFGRLEPSAGSWAGMGLTGKEAVEIPAFDSKERKIALGYNLSWNAQSVNGNPYSIHANCMRKVGWGNVVSKDDDGCPLTISAASKITPWSPQNVGPEMDNRGGVPFRYVSPEEAAGPTHPTRFHFEADETAPGTPMLVAFSTNAAGIIYDSGFSPGELVEGVEVGKRWWADINYADPGSNLKLEVSVTVSSADGKYPKPDGAPWTLRNECPLPPGNEPGDSSPLRLNANFVKRLTTPGGKGPACIRAVDCCAGYNGNTDVSQPQDMRCVSDYVWRARTTVTATVACIRRWDTTRTPFFYVPDPWEGTIPAEEGAPHPYKFAPDAPAGGSPYFFNFSGSKTGWFVGEVVFTAPHPFRWGDHLVTANVASLAGFQITNGPAETMASGIRNASNVFMIPTGTISCAFLAWGGTSKNMPEPQYINQVAADFPVNDPGATMTTWLPDMGTLPLEMHAAACAQWPGCRVWRNIPANASWALVEEMARRDLESKAEDSELCLEIANEVWSGQTQSSHIFTSYANLGFFGPNGGQGRSTGMAGFMARCKAIYKRVFDERGRGHEIKLVLGGQFGGGNFGSAAEAANAYNSKYLAADGHPECSVDYMAGASYAAVPKGTSLLYLWSALYPHASDGYSAGTEYPVTAPQICDVLRHHLLLNTSDNGPTGHFNQMNCNIAKYVPSASQGEGFLPIGVGYEGSFQSVATLLSAVKTSVLQHVFTHDIWSHPAFGDVQDTYWIACQQSMAWMCTYALVFPLYGVPNSHVNMWGDYYNDNQLWGTGDGSDGGPLNLPYDFCGEPIAGPNGRAQWHVNASVRGDRWRKWADVANPAPPVPPDPPKPEAVSVVVDVVMTSGGPPVPIAIMVGASSESLGTVTFAFCSGGYSVTPSAIQVCIHDESGHMARR